MCLDRLLALYPNHKKFLETKYELHEGLGEYDNAVACIDTLLEQSPNDEALLKKKIRLHEKAGQEDQAVATQKRLMSLGTAQIEDYMREVMLLGEPPKKEHKVHIKVLRRRYDINQAAFEDIVHGLKNLKTIKPESDEHGFEKVKDAENLIEEEPIADSIKRAPSDSYIGPESPSESIQGPFRTGESAPDDATSPEHRAPGSELEKEPEFVEEVIVEAEDFEEITDEDVDADFERFEKEEGSKARKNDEPEEDEKPLDWKR
jgi:tetratricopeptide (TPR) repeat protein